MTAHVEPPRNAYGLRPRVARVLIVDDEPNLADALGGLLSDEFEVRATSRSLEAFVWLSEGDWYDVILSDVVMPGMTGVELRERVHAIHPELAARIVFMTGSARGTPARAAVDDLPNLVLEKPLDVEAVRELVRRRTRVQPEQTCADLRSSRAR